MLVSEQTVSLGQEEFQPEIHDALTDEDVTAIRALLERSQELVMLADTDRRYSSELIGKFRTIARSLERSYHITPELIFEGRSQISDIVLTPEGILSFYCDSECVVSKPLESMTSESLIKIFTDILPTIESLTSEKIQNLPRQTKLQRLASDIKSALGIH